jgi:membrane-associated protease RseP (regulator of RpoE activity)
MLLENDAPYNLSKKPAWQQSIIILAWVFMNFLLAFFLFFILFLVWVKPIWVNDKIEMNSELKLIPTYKEAIEKWILIKNPWILINPVEWSIAINSWLKSWDIIYKIYSCKTNIIDEKTCEWWENVNTNTLNEPTNVSDIIKENAWKQLIFLVNEDNFIKIQVPEEWKIWIYLWENISVNENFIYKYWVLDSAKFALLETKNQVIITFKWLSYLVQKIFNPEKPEEREEAIKAMSWPIWIVSFISESLKAWIIFLIIFWAIISINLWVFNLLPIPALDWGRFLFIFINWIIEKLFWKKIIWPTSEAIIHFSFFILLIALSVIIAYNDISKIINN